MFVVGDGHVREGGTSPQTIDAVGTTKTGTITDGLVLTTEGGEVSVFGFSIVLCRCRVVVSLETPGKDYYVLNETFCTTDTLLPRETCPTSKPQLST